MGAVVVADPEADPVPILLLEEPEALQRIVRREIIPERLPVRGRDLVLIPGPDLSLNKWRLQLN